MNEVESYTRRMIVALIGPLRKTAESSNHIQLSEDADLRESKLGSKWRAHVDSDDAAGHAVRIKTQPGQALLAHLCMACLIPDEPRDIKLQIQRRGGYVV